MRCNEHSSRRRLRWQTRHVPGKPPKLEAEGFVWLLAVLKQPPRVCGIDAERWTNARLRMAVGARYGVGYSHFAHVENHLIARPVVAGVVAANCRPITFGINTTYTPHNATR